MTAHRLIDRRAAIKDLGRAGLAIMVFGAAACGGEPAGRSTTTGAANPTTTAGPTPTSAAGSPATTATGETPAATSFQRVDLEFVSAYILYRAGEAALVDTGVDGSADSIEAALGEAGLGWGSVGHVVLTHKHPDHVGSLDTVVERAPTALVYAGALEIPAITTSAGLRPLLGGDSVFGLEVIDTPGHTAGHISVLDPVAGVLVTGDALNGKAGGVIGPNPSFSEDMTVAHESVRALAGYDYATALFGHGEPMLEGASAAVADLAASLG